MSQNTSSAVMAQRKEAKDSLDLFPTPPWATRALCEWLGKFDPDLRVKTFWEPACGNGDMIKVLWEYFGAGIGSDVYAHKPGTVTFDFLMPGEPLCRPHWIITNPPFRLAEQFVDRAMGIAQTGVAMLVRLSFLEGIGRYERLFSKRPPMIAQFTERVTMVKGRLDESGGTATAYCWLIWYKDIASHPVQGCGTFQWIPPCRARLERASDYEVAA